MPEMTRQAEALRAEVAGLRITVVDLGEKTAALTERQTRSELRLWWVAGAALVAVVLAAGIGLTAWRGAATDARLDAICPVLALVVGGADPSTRPAGQARDRYVASIEVMRQSYRGLECERTSPPVPPRTPS